MTKYKNYENYKKTNIDYIEFIPSHWEQTQIKAVTRTSVIKKKPTEELLSVYREYGVIPKNSRDDNHNADGKDLSTYKYVSKNNLVVNKMKAWQGSMGVSNYNGIVSPAYIVCKLTDNVVPKYVHYLLRSKYYINYYNQISYGVRVGQWDMRYGDFKNLPFFIPTNEEQNKIVGFIEYKEKQINKLIKKQKKLIELLEEKKKIIITEAVTKGLDKSVPMKDSGIDYIGQVPQNWEVIKLKFISLCNKYSLDEQTDKNRQINYVDIGSVTNKDGITNVQKMLFKEAPSRARRIIHTNDTIISTVRTYLKAIAYIDEKYDNHICSTGFAVITPKNNIDPKFLFYILHSENFICKVERISTGANYPAITANKLINLKCLMPSLQEQKNIIKYIENIEVTINKLIENKNNLINKLEEYKKSLISFAVTGQIDVRDYEIPKTDDDVDLEEIENIYEDATETISEVEYANN